MLGLMLTAIFAAGLIVAILGKSKNIPMMFGAGGGMVLGAILVSLYLLIPAIFVKGVGGVLLFMGSVILGLGAGDKMRRAKKNS